MHYVLHPNEYLLVSLRRDDDDDVAVVVIIIVIITVKSCNNDGNNNRKNIFPFLPLHTAHLQQQKNIFRHSM